MEEPKQVATPPTEGVSEKKPESQASAPAEQSVEQKQEDGQSQVETTEQEASSTEETRKPSPSDYYRERQKYRRRVDNLENTISNLQDKLASFEKKQTVPEEPVPEFDNSAFLEDPVGNLEKMLAYRENQLRKKIFEEELPRIQQARELENSQQEALELIFPKSDTNSRESLEQRIQKDPERAARIQELLVETGLEEVSKTNPVKAAETVTRLYELEMADKKRAAERKPAPDTIKKSLMGSTATGTPNTAGGKPTMPSLDEVRSQVKALDKELERNPQLRFDENFKQRREAVKKMYEDLHQEMRKGQ